MPTFPVPVGLGAGRTAFYAQTNQSPCQATDNCPRMDIQSVSGPIAGNTQIGETVHDAAMEGGDATPNRRNVLGNHPASFTPMEGQTQSLAQDDSQQHDKRIGMAGYAPWVYQFSYESMPPTNGWRSTGDGPKYGWNHWNTYPHEAAHGSFGSDTVKPPSGGPVAKEEAKMAETPAAEEVKKAESPEAAPDAPAADKAKEPAADKAKEPAADEAKAPAGKDAKAPEAPAPAAKEAPAALMQKKHKHHHSHHHKAKDIGDNGIVEEVHGFASADKSVLP